MYDIIIGRSQKDKEKFGDKGTIFLGKQYIKMGQVTSLSNNVLLDVNRSHVIFVCGKRGSGKSYSLGVIAEGISSLPDEIRNNIAVVIFDTMGIYWTMKFPNHKEESLLEEWNLRGSAIDINLFTPAGFYNKYKEEKIPVDYPFSIKASELSALDWASIFNIPLESSLGVVIETAINKLKEAGRYTIDGIIKEINSSDFDSIMKVSAVNRFENAKQWGLFSETGFSISEIAKPGKINVIDVSAYASQANGIKIKSLVIGLITQKLFLERMIARKKEEQAAVQKAEHFFIEEESTRFPLVWLILDEAHEFLSSRGMTLASEPLITVLREGREPGISLVLASQQPGKIHSDVITQADITIAHRVTSRIDVDALKGLAQTYMAESIDKELNILPRETGAAIILDDMNEKFYPIGVRPRFSWHGGEAPTVLQNEKKII